MCEFVSNQLSKNRAETITCEYLDINLSVSIYISITTPKQ